MSHVPRIDKDVLLMEEDALNQPPSALITKELRHHANHSQEALKVFALMFLEQLPQVLALQELVLLTQQPLLMSHVQNGKVHVCGMELQDAKIFLLALVLMEQLIHARHLLEAMVHAQELDQSQQLVFLILQFVIKHLLHSSRMLNARHGTQVAWLMDLDV